MSTVAILNARMDADFSKYHQGIRQSVASTEELGQTMQSVQRGAQGMIGFLERAAERALSFAAAQVAIRASSEIWNKITGAVIGMNATLETSSLQFENLLGNADLAAQHVRSLFDFAKKTPFETGPVIEASKLLQTFGGAALNTKDNLTLVGDAAAVANRPISEIAFWIGRSYSAIKNGQPFGEAAQRLQELTILSGEGRTKIEALQKAGASSTAIWAVMTAELSKTKGAMDKLQFTWAGLTSTFSDTIKILSSTAFKPVFDILSMGLKNVNEFIGQDEFGEWAKRIAAGIQVAISALAPLVGAFSTAFGAVLRVVTSVGGAVLKAMQLINPLARHSPSLVENVEMGIDRIIAKYEQLSDIEGPLRAAGSLVVSFNDQVRAGLAGLEKIQTAGQAKSIGTVFGGGAATTFTSGLSSIAAAKEDLKPLKDQIEAQTDVVAPLKKDYEDAQKALAILDRQIQVAERDFRPFTQAIVDAKNAAQPFSDAVAAQQTVVQRAQLDLDLAKDGLHGYADATALASTNLDDAKTSLETARFGFTSLKNSVEDSKLALDQKKLALDVAKTSLDKYSDAVTDTKTHLGDLQEALSRVKDRMKELTDTPLEGTQKYLDALKAIQSRIQTVDLQIATVQSKQRPGASASPQLQRLQEVRQTLGHQQEVIRLNKEIDIGGKQTQLTEALNPRKTETSFSSQIAEAQKLGAAQASLDPQILATNHTLRDQEEALSAASRAYRPEERAVRDAERAHQALANTYALETQSLNPLVAKVAELTIIRERAANAQQVAEQSLRGFQENLVIEQRNLTTAQLALVPYTIGIDLATRALEAQKLTLQETHDLRTTAADDVADTKAAYDEEKESLDKLSEAYTGAIGLLNSYKASLLEVAQAADAEIARRAQLAKVPEAQANNAPDADAIAQAVADAAAEKEKYDKMISDMETDAAGFISTVNGLAGGITTFADNLDTAYPSFAAFFGALQNGNTPEATEHLANGIEDLSGGFIKLNPSQIQTLAIVFSFLGDTFNLMYNGLLALLGLVEQLGGFWEIAKAIAIAFVAWQFIAPIVAGIMGAIALLTPVVLAVGSALEFSGALAAFTVLGEGILALIGGPVTLLVAALALLVVAWFENWGDIQGKTEGVITAIKGFWDNTLMPVFEAIGNWITGTLVPAFQAWWRVLGEVWKYINENIVPILRTFVGIITELWGVANSLETLALTPLRLAFEWLFRVLDQPESKTSRNAFLAFLQEAGNFIKNTVLQALDDLKRRFENLQQPLANLNTWLQEHVLGPLREFKGLLDVINGVKVTPPALPPLTIDQAAYNADHTQQIAPPRTGAVEMQLASGGLVTKPTIALIGEKGPELVIPLNGLQFARAGEISGGIGGHGIEPVQTALTSSNMQVPEATKFERADKGRGYTDSSWTPLIVAMDVLGTKIDAALGPESMGHGAGGRGPTGGYDTILGLGPSSGSWNSSVATAANEVPGKYGIIPENIDSKSWNREAGGGQASSPTPISQTYNQYGPIIGVDGGVGAIADLLADEAERRLRSRIQTSG